MDPKDSSFWQHTVYAVIEQGLVELIKTHNLEWRVKQK